MFSSMKLSSENRGKWDFRAPRNKFPPSPKRLAPLGAQVIFSSLHPPRKMHATPLRLLCDCFGFPLKELCTCSVKAL